MAWRFSDSFNKLKRSEKKRLKDFLEFWKRVRGKEGVIIINNLMHERFLEETAMDDLVRHILDLLKGYSKLHKSQINLIEKEIRSAFYQKLQLKGSIIKCPPPLQIGVVVPKNRLDFDYLKSFKYNEWELQKFFENISSMKFRKTRKKLWIRDPKYLIWFTWCKQNSDSYPFCFAKLGTKKEVSVFLGLGYEEYNIGKLYAFVFDNNLIHSSGGRLYRPTFCDADLGVYFRPPENEDRFGLTLPTEKTIKDFNRKIHTSRQPEAVIRSRFVTFNNLMDYRILV